MRSVGGSLQTFLDTHTAAVWRHLVTVTPRTGSAVYWTDHTSDLVYGGHTFLHGGEGTTVPVITIGKRYEVAGTEIGSLDITLGCGSGALWGSVRLPKAAADRAFDGATIKVERVYGAADIDLSLGTMHVFEGLVAEARPSSTSVELDVECGLAALNVEVPRRTFKPGCTNTFCDAQCGLNIAVYTTTGQAGTGATAKIITSNLTDADGYFDLGVITFSSGVNAGLSRGVASYDNTNGAVTVDRPFPAAPAQFDEFDITVGCPKTLDACENKFAADNRTHYRGFPFAPADSRSLPAEGLVSYSRAHGWMTGPEYIPPDNVSTYGKPVPLLWGTQRIRGRWIYWGTLVDSVVPIQVALCEGAIDSIVQEFSPYNTTAWEVLGARYHLDTGTRPTQTAWADLPAGKDLGYPGVSVLSYYAQVENGIVPEREWEVVGKLAGTGGTDDADPAQIVADLLYNGGPLAGSANADAQYGAYGAGFPFTVVTNVGLDGLAASSYARYIAQNAFYLSPYLDEKRQAIDVLQEWCDATNSEALWSSASGAGVLKIIPRADEAVGTFTPCTTTRYAFGESDFGDNADPVSVTLEPETNSFNTCTISFRERAPTGASTDKTLRYQDSTEEGQDPVDVALRGERPAPEARFPAICVRSHANKLAKILAQRQVRTRQSVEFTVGFRFAQLEPLDLVTITDSLFPYSAQPFQIRKIEEDEGGKLKITAQEWTAGVNSSTEHTTQSSDGATTNWTASKILNLGQTVLQGATTAGTLTFGIDEPDTNYDIIATPVATSGAVTQGSLIVKSIVKYASSAVITMADGPGVGCEVSWQFYLIRTI